MAPTCSACAFATADRPNDDDHPMNVRPACAICGANHPRIRLRCALAAAPSRGRVLVRSGSATRSMSRHSPVGKEWPCTRTGRAMAARPPAVAAYTISVPERPAPAPRPVQSPSGDRAISGNQTSRVNSPPTGLAKTSAHHRRHHAAVARSILLGLPPPSPPHAFTTISTCSATQGTTPVQCDRTRGSLESRAQREHALSGSGAM